MYPALSPGAIGVRVGSLEAAVEAAREGGFSAVELDIAQVASTIESNGVDHVRERLDATGLRPAGWSVPDTWRGDEAAWRGCIASLPRLAAAAAAIGYTRVSTWILPASDELPREENLRWHTERLKPVAAVLDEHGCRLGLEYVGPSTMREGKRYSFIYNMEGMLELASAVGPNTGLLLDCWHWYTAGETTAALRALRPEQVVYVHVNDAPAGIPIEAQQDHTRALPGETGVIDIRGFLGSLAAIGYDGPVVPEPFKRELAELPSDAARLQLVGAAMRKIFEQAGLSVESSALRQRAQG